MTKNELQRVIHRALQAANDAWNGRRLDGYPLSPQDCAEIAADVVEPMMRLLRLYHSQEVEFAEIVLSQAKKAMSACETAWAIIANIDGGDWTYQSHEWQRAAERWRDEQWHPLLKETNSLWIETPPLPSESEQIVVSDA